MPSSRQGEITKEVVRGVAITSLIFVVAIYLPIFGFFCALFIPLPVLYYRTRLGRTHGAAVPGLTCLVMALIAGKVSMDTLFFVELLLLGFVLGEVFEANLSVEKTVLLSSGIVLGLGATAILFYAPTAGKSVWALIDDYVATNLQLTVALYENMGVSEEKIRLISSSLEYIRYTLVRIIPALAAASTLLVTWLSLLLARPLLAWQELPYPAFGPLNRWKVPEQLVWGVIGCGLLLIVPARWLNMVGLNGLILFMTVYFFAGIAIVSFYFEKKQFPRMLKVFLYALIALQQIVLLIVIGLGFFDMWVNFRKMETKQKN
jgi:uncharacterized protein YybS (DUF2232 family)